MNCRFASLVAPRNHLDAIFAPSRARFLGNTRGVSRSAFHIKDNSDAVTHSTYSSTVGSDTMNARRLQLVHVYEGSENEGWMMGIED